LAVEVLGGDGGNVRVDGHVLRHGGAKEEAIEPASKNI